MILLRDLVEEFGLGLIHRVSLSVLAHWAVPLARILLSRVALSPDGRRLWVQERETSKVSVFDAQTFERVASLAAGNAPATTEFTPSRRYAVTTHIGDQIIKVFETDTFQEVKTIRVGQNPVNSVFRPDGRYAYVTNKASDTVSIIDVERWEAVKTLDVGKTPWGIYLFDPTRGEMAGNRY